MRQATLTLAIILIAGLALAGCMTPLPPVFTPADQAAPEAAAPAPAEPAAQPTSEPIQQPPAAPVPPAAAADPLAGTAWEWAPEQPPDQGTFTLEFLPDGQVAIMADCNSVLGRYTVDGANLTIMLGPSTMAFCGEDSLDQQYLSSLAQVSAFAMQDAALELTVQDGTVMPFVSMERLVEAPPAAEAVEPAPAAVTSLTNVLWQLTSVSAGGETVDIVEPERYQVAFLADGQFALRADCNRGRGEYTTGAEGSIAMEVKVMTRAMCGPNSLSSAFVAGLDSTTGYTLEAGGLQLAMADNAGTMSFMPAGAAVTGVVTYLQRSMLPPDAVVRVTIEDVSRADAPALILGEQIIQTEGRQVPIPFAVAYDSTLVQETHTYSLRAQIRDGAGKLLFTSDTVIPVITRGSPVSGVEVLVVPVP